MYKLFFKRVLDFCISLFALFIISPLLLVVTIWLHFANKGAGSLTPNPSPKGEGNWLQRWFQPVIFTQERPGKDAKIFKVIKFKTMTDERGPDGELLPADKRVTKIGKVLRSLSLDELPQLFNVLIGDMSLIGPRPLMPGYLSLYNKEQSRRHEVRPGITGWAQVNGRNTISWTKKFEYDVWYVDHVSLWLDVKIVFMTIKNVFLRKDINSSKDSIGAPIGFRGNN